MKNFTTETEQQLKQTLGIFIKKAFVLLKYEYGHLMNRNEINMIKGVFEKALSNEYDYFEKALKDMAFIYEKDPALTNKEEREAVVYKSLPLLLLHRIAHDFYTQNNPTIGRYLSEINRQMNQAEIHPGAKIGTQIFIDHPTGLIIGETAVIGNRFQSFGQVLLGNNGKHLKGRRHPRIGDNVTIYPQTVVSGPLTIGDNAVIGVGSTITINVPQNGVVVAVNQLTRVARQKYNMPLKEYWSNRRIRGN